MLESHAPPDPRSAADLGGSNGIWSWSLVGERFELLSSDDSRSTLLPAEFADTRDAFLALLHPQDRGRVAAAFKAARHGARRTAIGFRLTDTAGRQRWFVLRTRGAPPSGDARTEVSGTIEEAAGPVDGPQRR